MPCSLNVWNGSNLTAAHVEQRKGLREKNLYDYYKLYNILQEFYLEDLAPFFGSYWITKIHETKIGSLLQASLILKALD